MYYVCFSPGELQCLNSHTKPMRGLGSCSHVCAIPPLSKLNTKCKTPLWMEGRKNKKPYGEGQGKVQRQRRLVFQAAADELWDIRKLLWPLRNFTQFKSSEMGHALTPFARVLWRSGLSVNAASCLAALKESPSNPQRAASVCPPETPGLLGGAELHFLLLLWLLSADLQVCRVSEW